ncbi:TIGR03564 family F420-dependent LLM class oxidoreductase [Microbispora sp. KK1-11]|uniref:TIGR03564 family F420-dependent LLM class oxidoreductase n=1 Tax=Microbispora sp. KK1-11 TaxID=2053005 RepID=UPI001157C555|nr:TIGR03564 family F420-dependent LLM class oxidoreductase [Microbispora sp. KK1-11]TQS28835.1 TIGR03564 family F420-dependent LLM class oxidoreductase [Microbispora sp. KK1-11]
MRIGVLVGEVRGAVTAEEFAGQVRAAAQAGLATAWSAQALGWDALTALAMAGAHVPGIALGSAVVPVPARHPLVLASQALSVQAATGNRLTLGIGVGIAMMTRTMFGLSAERPVARMREYLSVLRPLLRGEQVSHRGETFTAEGAVNVPGAAPPPVLLAALGPAMLRLAGEHADGVVTWMTGPRTLAGHVVPTVTRAAHAAGRPSPRVVAGLIVCVTDDEQGVRRRIAGEFGLAGQVPEYRAVLDREGVEGPEDVVIVGGEQAVVRRIGRLAEAGVTEFAASPYGDAGEQERTLAVLAGLARSARYSM